MRLKYVLFLGLALCLLAVRSAEAEPTDTAAAEAKHLYQVALVAIRAGDFTAAEEKLAKAAALLPSNALIFYNLAVVQSKTDHLAEAVASLKRAQELGLPIDSQEAAETLSAELEYRAELFQRSAYLAGVYRATESGRAATLGPDGKPGPTHETTVVQEFRVTSVGPPMTVAVANSSQEANTAADARTYTIEATRISPTGYKGVVRRVEASRFNTCETPAFAMTFRFDAGEVVVVEMPEHQVRCELPGEPSLSHVYFENATKWTLAKAKTSATVETRQ